MISTCRFGYVFSKLIEISRLDSSKLASKINVHPSVISRWVNEKRRIPLKSNYIESIAKVLAENINSTAQKKQLKIFFSNLNLTLMEENPQYVEDSIFKILNIYRDSVYENSTDEPVIDKPLVNDSTFSSPVEVLVSSNQIMSAIIKLLTNVYKLDNISDANICITHINSFIDGVEDKDLKDQYKLLIKGLIAERATIEEVIVIDHNNLSGTTLLDSLTYSLMSKNYTPYFIDVKPKASTLDYFAVENHGAIMLLSAPNKNGEKVAYFFKDDHMIDNVMSQINLVKSNAITYTDNSDSTIAEDILSHESCLGNRYTFSPGFSQLSVTHEYLNCILESRDTNIDNYDVNVSRIQQFENQISVFQAFELISIEETEKFILNKDYLDQGISSNDLRTYFSCLKQLILKYDNFKVGLISVSCYNNLCRHLWSTKGQKGVFIQNHNYLNMGLNCDLNYDDSFERAYMKLDHPYIAMVFKNYFESYWNQIPELYKDKMYITKWIDNLLLCI